MSKAIKIQKKCLFGEIIILGRLIPFKILILQFT
jgi:hypothetical protein